MTDTSVSEAWETLYLVRDNYSLVLRGAEGVVGKSPDPDVQTLRNSYVSSRHLAWYRSGPESVEVEDLDSKNGTFLAGERMVSGERYELRLGARLDIARDGDWILTSDSLRDATFVKGAPIARFRESSNFEVVVTIFVDKVELAAVSGLRARGRISRKIRSTLASAIEL